MTMMALHAHGWNKLSELKVNGNTEMMEENYFAALITACIVVKKYCTEHYYICRATPTILFPTVSLSL